MEIARVTDAATPNIARLSHSQIVWYRFKKHRLAVVSVLFLAVIYAVGAFCEFFAPYDPDDHGALRVTQPPQAIRFFGRDGFHLRPFVYGFVRARDPVTLELIYKPDRTKEYPLRLFVHGHRYRLLGLIPVDVHLFGAEDGRVSLFGTDELGRDMFSRILYGARVSTSIGLLGVLISFVLGLTMGGVAGYFGGVIDTFVQRTTELLRSIPRIPLWLGLSAALPVNWPPMRVYLAIVLILSLVSWTGLARVVRSKFLSLRKEEFVMAALLSGNSHYRLIFRHMVPNFTSHIIASLTLAIPHMILSETSLSFLGLGLRPPAVSWGVLLQSAQNIRSVAYAPWLLLPGVAVIVTVLAFNFLGDGIRDAADPFGEGR